jgi:hypothetical protein
MFKIIKTEPINKQFFNTFFNIYFNTKQISLLYEKYNIPLHKNHYQITQTINTNLLKRTAREYYNITTKQQAQDLQHYSNDELINMLIYIPFDDYCKQHNYIFEKHISQIMRTKLKHTIPQ